jgi:hypothetical protein
MEQASFLTGCPLLGALHPNPMATNATEQRRKEKLRIIIGEGMGNPKTSVGPPPPYSKLKRVLL